MLDEIFKKIQASQTTQPKYTKPRNENILHMEPGQTYIVRLIPYLKKPESTFVTFMNHGWESRKNNRYISIPCLKTWGRSEKCPACEIRFAELKIGSEAAKAKARMLRQKNTSFVNVYVIDSPNVDEKNKVKIVRYGAELDKIIKAAISGEDAEEFGMRVVDLSPEGVDFRIRVETKGTGKDAIPTYAMSKFISKRHDLGLSGADIQTIYDNAHDLTSLVPVRKTFAELEAVLQEHYFGAEQINNTKEYISVEEEEEINTNTVYQDNANTSNEPAAKTVPVAANNIDDKVNELLKEFSILPGE